MFQTSPSWATKDEKKTPPVLKHVKGKKDVTTWAQEHCFQ